MAKIELRDLHHSYASQETDSGFAIRDLNLTWEDGSANALLGPSGCGKTTLLNIISGLLRPSSGQVLFDGVDVSQLSTRDRHIAQVFQFPVVYDTMTVFDNLAFPLRNRRTGEREVRARVAEIAELLDLGGVLTRSAGRLNPAQKQVVSLGRGIVRKDTAAVLLDEPLTVIDPVLKLDLRRKLRSIQQELNMAMIYVTHDQHEALTFADWVTLMDRGKVIQSASPEALFLNPQTPFVGFFIGSPGMNMMRCEVSGQRTRIKGSPLEVPEIIAARVRSVAGAIDLGIRPEFVETSTKPKAEWNVFSLQAVDHAGSYQVLTLKSGQLRIKARVDDQFEATEADRIWVRFPPENVKIYEDGELIP
ncbi:MAG: ABC transporter ATP-binding protein [Verrucomicrobia bacterium]|nr:MAG: ABC transporter ATP-binding protein [Verrucomicrobiota bacterium]